MSTKNKFPKEYINLLNMDKILKNTTNIDKLKVTLKHNEIKGTGLYATKHIKNDEIIAYYRITAFDYHRYTSPTNYIYAFDVYTPTGRESKNLIGDIDLNSFPKQVNDIPFWAPFANEPSVGQKINSEIDLNIDENYKNKKQKRIKHLQQLTYKLIAKCDIFPGDEITLYYGDEYPRNYEIDCIEKY